MVVPEPVNPGQAASPEPSGALQVNSANSPDPCAGKGLEGPVRVQIGTVEAGIHVGGTISLPVRVKGVCGLAAFRLWVTYDRTVLKLEEVLPAPFLAGDPPVELEFVGLRPGAARQTVEGARPEGLGGVDGIGTLARLIFKGLSEGSTEIQLVRLQLFAEDGSLIPSRPYPVRMTVYPVRRRPGDPRRNPVPRP